MSIFKGKRYPYGIHVPDRKEFSNEKPIENMPYPNKVYLSMQQHIGAPAIPVVNVGDKVKIGQIVGKENGVVSANVLASIAGTVVDICDIKNGLGQIQKHVVIENDFSNEVEKFPALENFDNQSIINRIRDCGIVGLGGAGFPTAVKLTPKNQLDVLIINGAECEPYLNCDYRLMLEKTEEIYQGIKLVAKILNVNKIIFGIEANKPKAIELFSNYPDIDVCVLKKQYPMGSEKHLIYSATGRKVPVGKMPFDIGCCVQNIKTVIACYEAVYLNLPLNEIVVTVSGKGIENAKNVRVPLGTSYDDLIAYCGGEKDACKIVTGGPMMGKALINTTHFVRKTDSGLLLLTSNESDSRQPTNCINCTMCAKNCPMRLMPMYIEAYALAGDFKNAEKYGAMNCLECGSCAFNCPAKRPLVQSITYAKAKIKEMKQNAK